MVDLKKWAFKHRIYLKIEPDKPVTCKFLKAEAFVDHENEDREKVRYFFEVDGAEKQFESQSTGLAEQMGEFEEGDWVTITRTGKGRATRYEVKKKKK